MDLGRGANPNSYMIEEIWQELAKAKYLEWESESTKHTWELQTLKYVVFSIAFGPFMLIEFLFGSSYDLFGSF